MNTRALNYIPFYSKASVVTTNRNQDCYKGDVVTKLGILSDAPKLLVYNHRTRTTCSVRASDMIDMDKM